jgi:hypothetical protein
VKEGYKMGYAKYHEKYHSTQSTFWKKAKDKKAAKQEERNWNAFQNPEEKLTLLKYSSKKPKNIVKTRYKGIYKEKMKKVS